MMNLSDNETADFRDAMVSIDFYISCFNLDLIFVEAKNAKRPKS